jgi:hypothetical protein
MRTIRLVNGFHLILDAEMASFVVPEKSIATLLLCLSTLVPLSIASRVAPFRILLGGREFFYSLIRYG